MQAKPYQLPAIDAETKAHLERTSRIRFKQNLIQGFSGPTIFGLVGAAGTALIAFAATNPLAWVAIGLLACTAVGALYFSSKLNSEVSRLDQDYQARQIAKGIAAPSPVIEQKPVALPSQSQSTNFDAADTPDTQQPDKIVKAVTHAGQVAANAQLQDKLVPLVAAEKSADAAWVERMAANENQPATSTVRA